MGYICKGKTLRSTNLTRDDLFEKTKDCSDLKCFVWAKYPVCIDLEQKGEKGGAKMTECCQKDAGVIASMEGTAVHGYPDCYDDHIEFQEFIDK